MADERLEKARAFVDNLKGRRTGREEEWRHLAEWIAPHRGIFTGEDGAPRYERRNRDAFTQIASQALLRGASGMTSGMTPRNVSWFKPDFIDAEMSEASGARSWLDAFDMRMKDCLADGGFYQAIQAFNMDLLWAGCAMLYCERGEAAPLRFECVQIGTFWVELNEDGRVDAAAREFMLTPAVLAGKFGEDALSEKSRERLKSRPYEPVRITHLARRRDLDADAPPGKREMSYESLFWEEGGVDKFLHEGGFYEMPYFFTRWHEGVTPYGTGPGDDALADSRQIDKLEKLKLEGLDKLLNPPVSCPFELKDVVDLYPGGITFVRDPNRERIQPILDLSPYAGAMRNVMEEIQTVALRLEQELMASIFTSTPLDQKPPDMTATEFLERKREALQQLGPVISAYEPNVLTPLLFRVARTLEREGMMPPVPEALQGYPLFMKMEFVSPMANALRQTGAETTRALFADVAAMFQATQNMEIFDKVDLDQMIDELAAGLGAPGRVVRADADVAALREQRAAAMAEAREQEREVARAQTMNMDAKTAQAGASAAKTVNDMLGGNDMFPLIAGLVMAGLSGFSALAGAETKRNQQRSQAAAMEQRAEQARRQALLAREKSRIEAQGIDRQKRDIRRKFNEVQGHNRSLLAAGNVDMASGSALDVSLGNIDRFAADMGENAYERALRLWEGKESEKNLNYQADAMDANASYLKNTAGTIGTSLLTAAISGASGFARGYSMFGGDFSSWFKDSSLPGQMAGTRYAWDQETPAGLLMRHPSGRLAFVQKK